MLMVNQLVGFGVAGTTISPTDIAGLQLWLRADLGVTKDGSDLVATWADQSGNGRDLTEATNKPLWVSGLINSQPAVRFDGADDRLSSGAFGVSQPLTIFAVFKNISSTVGDRVYATDAGAGNTPNLVQTAGPNLDLQSNGLNGAAVATDTTNFHYYKCVFNGTSSVLSKDGGADQTSGNNLSGSPVIFHLGHHNGASFANIEVAEVLFYNSAISGANLTSINSYFASRYAL